MSMSGAVEAEALWASLLDRVEQGERITIARDGKPVARLVPMAAAAFDRERTREAIRRIREGMAPAGGSREDRRR